MVEVPCKHPCALRRRETSSIRVPVILPHELFSWLAENKRFVVAPHVIANFWKRWKQTKWFHPAQEKGIHNPIAITGDDAKYTLGGAKLIIIAASLVCVDRAKRRENNDIQISSCSNEQDNMFFYFKPSFPFHTLLTVTSGPLSQMTATFPDQVLM